jgi:hypothetical protein
MEQDKQRRTEHDPIEGVRFSEDKEEEDRSCLDFWEVPVENPSKADVATDFTEMEVGIFPVKA